jgi:hypothetical protein
VLNAWYGGGVNAAMSGRCSREAAAQLPAAGRPIVNASPSTIPHNSLLPCFIRPGARSCSESTHGPTRLGAGSRVAVASPHAGGGTPAWVWGVVAGGVLLGGAGVASALLRRSRSTSVSVSGARRTGWWSRP